MIGSLTPGRDVTITLDHAEEVLAEPFFSISRERFEIREPVLDDVIQLQSGCFILKPLNDLDAVHETTVGQSGTLRLSEFNAAACVEEIPRQRQYSELTGLSPSGAVASTGDYWCTKRVAAGASWAQEINYALAKPTLPGTLHYPLDRVLEHQQTLVDLLTSFQDTGFLLRWEAPGSASDLADWHFVFYFGGELFGRPAYPVKGYGLFALAVGGQGRALLFERIEDAWEQVADFQYAAAATVPGRGHVLRIIPHIRYIEFKSQIHDRVEPNMLLNQSRLSAFSGRIVAADTFTYEAKNRAEIPNPFPGRAPSMTGGQYVALDVRRDLRLTWQINRLLYPASGTLTDRPFVVPHDPDVSDHALEVVPHGFLTTVVLGSIEASRVTVEAQDAQDGSPLATKQEVYSFGGESRTIDGWELPGSPNAVQIEFTFENLGGSGTPFTPYFVGYEARKRGTQATPTVTALTIDKTHFRQSPCSYLTITGQDADPSHETAGMVIEDYTNRAAVLRTRATIPCRIKTSYDGDPAKLSVLFEGYVIKTRSRLRGREGRTWPSADWHSHDCQLLGKWVRLKDRDWAGEIQTFHEDPSPSAPRVGGVPAPWKVTDAIRHVLAVAGFSAAQVSLIPDYPLRFWYSGLQDHRDILELWPGESLADALLTWARDYFNATLLWDANALATGAFRLKQPIQGTESPLWSFVVGTAPAGRLATAPGAYGATSTFVASDTLEEWVVPPEGNSLTVYGYVNGEKLRGYATNPKSYGAGADTSDPDYIGRHIPIIRRPDPTLVTPQAVRFVTRTIFERACRAQLWARFAAPLVLVDPGEASVYTTYLRRPLQAYDPIYLNGELYMVRNVTLDLLKQHHGMMVVECQKYRAPLGT